MTDDQPRNNQLAASAMLEATGRAADPGRSNPEYESEGGSATGVVACFHRTSRTAGRMHAASIGDAALIVVHVRQSVARQLNPIHRTHPKDTGGQLTMCIGIDGPVWALTTPISSDEIVVLSTDGLTDNVHLPELHLIIPLLIASPLFDRPVAFPCRSQPTQKPSLDYLRQVVGDRLEVLASVPCHAAATRLFNYVEWVTRDYFLQEETYYSMCLELGALQKQQPSPEISARIQTLQDQTRDLSALRKQTEHSAKTDDAMVLVLRPFNTL